MTNIIDNFDVFRKIRDEKEKFFAQPENSDKYFILIKDLMRTQENFDLNLYRDHYLKGRFFQRIRAKKFVSFKNYWNILKKDSKEIQTLKGLLTIHTTEFFRDVKPFEYLEKELLPKIDHIHTNSAVPIRILSAPCSTGQEAYSMAMIVHRLKKKKALKHSIEIHGIDIDKPSIKSAQTGIYRKDLLTNMTKQEISSNFNELKNGDFQIKDDIKQYCHFETSDMFKPLPFAYNFNLIVCRNFLIYISRDEQSKIYENLKNSALRDAFFMLGLTEGLNLMRDREFSVESLDHHFYQFVGEGSAKRKPIEIRTKQPVSKKERAQKKTPLEIKNIREQKQKKSQKKEADKKSVRTATKKIKKAPEPATKKVQQTVPDITAVIHPKKILHTDPPTIIPSETGSRVPVRIIGKKINPKEINAKRMEQEELLSVEEQMKLRSKTKDDDLVKLVRKARLARKTQIHEIEDYEHIEDPVQRLESLKRKKSSTEAMLEKIITQSQTTEENLFEDHLEEREIRSLQRKLERLKVVEWDKSQELKKIVQEIAELEKN